METTTARMIETKIKMKMKMSSMRANKKVQKTQSRPAAMVGAKRMEVEVEVEEVTLLTVPRLTLLRKTMTRRIN